MGSVGPEGKTPLLNTTRARPVASKRRCRSNKRSRSSVRRATAIPCIARFSLISLGVCMLERRSTLRQVTSVTACAHTHAQFPQRRKSSEVQGKRKPPGHRRTAGKTPDQTRTDEKYFKPSREL